MFDEMHDAFGKQWQYWRQETPPGSQNKPYAEIAEELPNVGILNRANDPDGLRAKATSASAFIIEGNHLAYGADLPEWAGVHLHGGLTISEDGYRIPQRSFYPYSAEGVAKVTALFESWMDSNIRAMPRVSSLGKHYVQTRVGGRFGPNV